MTCSMLMVQFKAESFQLIQLVTRQTFGNSKNLQRWAYCSLVRSRRIIHHSIFVQYLGEYSNIRLCAAFAQFIKFNLES